MEFVQIEHKGSFMKEPNQGGCCGCVVVVFVFNLLFGGLLFDYCLYSILGKDIHWAGDMICGFILAEACLPVAAVCFVLRLFGVEAPFLH